MTGATIRKPFQNATVEHVVAQLRSPGASRRFLVADEVGLGKTLVAQGVIEHLMKRRGRSGRSPCVLYVCSNLTIARQNHDALIEFLEPGQANERREDRLSLLARDALDDSTGLRLYSLTPYTSSGSGRGRASERALLANAVDALAMRSKIDGRTAGPIIAQLGLRIDPRAFAYLRAQDRSQIEDGRVIDAFRRHLCHELGAAAQAHTRTLLRNLRGKLREDPIDAVERLRRAMALAVIDFLAPDLVILDEFQRFAEMLPTDDADEDGEATSDPTMQGDAREVNTVMRAILRSASPRNRRPWVLMLSATPYRLYTRASDPHQHHEGFFEVMSFLLDDRECLASLKDLFRAYREQLAITSPGDRKLLRIRDQIETLLLPVMCRTERPLDAAQSTLRTPDLSLEAADVKVFRQLAEIATTTPVCAEPYWSSIPYTLQAMDRNYALRKYVDDEGRRAASRVEAPELSFDAVRGYEGIDHSHPRLRALLDVVPASVRALPWLPPTIAWWKLGPPFTEASGASKALLFSHFRATPRILAAVVSYEAEREAYARSETRYDYRLRSRSAMCDAQDERVAVSKERLQHQPRSAFSMVRGADRLATNVKTVLHFTPFLAECLDPLVMAADARKHGDAELLFERARELAAKSLLDILGITEARRTTRCFDWVAIARWVITIEARHDEVRLNRLRAAFLQWADEHDDRRGAADACRHLAVLDPFGASASPTSAELAILAELALASPGAVLFRAWARIFGSARRGHLETRMQSLLSIGLLDLASYLDTPEWHVSLRTADFGKHPGRRSFADVIRTAVWNGNFESVLDELLATYVRFSRPTRARRVQEKTCRDRLSRALQLRDASVALRRTVTSGPDRTIRMRCHAAAPLGLTVEAREENEVLRTDNLRVAFNSPFRPMMLVTTSIGQEGLDFHTYARRIVHWDLPSDPVELEQRDGRIMRFGSLAVRRALAARFVHGNAPLAPRGSPWLTIGEQAKKTESVDGMRPWWVANGASIERVLLVPPFSRQRADFDELEELVALYRLALGQPNQEHLIRAVRARIEDNAGAPGLREWYRTVSLRLSPFERTTATR